MSKMQLKNNESDSMPCILRPATIDDAQILFDWTNDPVTRAGSFSTKPVQWDEHLGWLTKVFENANRHLYIVMGNTIFGMPVGMLRLDIEGGQAEISYSVAPQYRGRGIGKQILLLAQDEIKNNFPEVSSLIAKVKPDNVASMKAFSHTGFTEKYVEYELLMR